MLTSRLHPQRGNRPERRLNVNFRPGRPANLSGSRGCQHRELERLCANARLRPQALHEHGDILHFDSRVVTNRCHLGRIRQRGIEVSLPACGVEAFPIATRCRVVKHELDARPHARRSFCLGRPDGLENCDHMGRTNVPNQKLANRRLRVSP